MLQRFLQFGRPHAPSYALGFALLLVTNGLGLAIPWLLREAIRAIEAGEATATVGRLALAMVAIALVQAGVRTLSRLAILGASRRIVFDVRDTFFDHLQRLGTDFYDHQRTGDIMSRGINDTRLVQGFFGPGMLNLLNTGIVYVAVLVLLLQIDVALTLVALTLYPLLFWGVKRLSRRVYARSMAVQEQLATISNRAQESISGIQQIKIFAQEERETAAFRELCAEYRRRNLSMAALRGGMLALIGGVSGLGVLIVLYLGGRFVISGRMDLGDFVAFNAYLAMLVWPTIALGWIINTIQRGAGAMRRIDDVLRHDPEPATTGSVDIGVEATTVPTVGDIEIRGLTFRYPLAQPRRPPMPPPVLDDVTLTIPRGASVALVGAVGSGKSTMTHLLARLYPVPSGTIFFDGRDINEVPLGALRRAIAYVPQEAFLFSRSLRENIALGQPDASEDAVRRSVELAHLAGDVAGFPRGLETPVGERGYTLSGGQRQRATLARAALAERELLILDDSLSSVDADTERAILEALRDRRQSRTLVLISHRLSTLVEMDRIVVLDRGRVVEQGTHDELLARGGAYARLFRRQQLERRLSGS